MSLPPPPPGTDLAANQQPEIIGSIIATWVFAVIAVALRFFARRVSRAGFWWDDWLMLPALVRTRLQILANPRLWANMRSGFRHDTLFYIDRMAWVLP